MINYYGIFLSSNTPLLQILNTPVEPIHGTTTRGSGLNRLIKLKGESMRKLSLTNSNNSEK